MMAHVAPVPSLSISSPASSSIITCLVLIAVLGVLDLLIVGLRIFVRLKRVGRFSLNDYFLFVGSILTFANTGLTIGVVCQGVADHHLKEVLKLVPERWPLAMQMTLAAEFCWIIAVIFLKLSILGLYLQIFGHDRRFLWTVRLIGILVIVVGIVTCLLTATHCVPFSSYWNLFVPNRRCDSPWASFLATAVLSLVFDLIILILPMFKLWNLNMSTKKKVGMTIVFGIGFAVCGVQAWRVQVITHYNFQDITHGLTFLGAATTFELQLGVIVVSVPVVAPAFYHTTSTLGTFGSRISVWIRGRTTNHSTSDPQSSKLSDLTPNKMNKPTESQVDRRNFKKLYDHMYPMSNLDGRSQVDTQVAANSSTFDENDGRGLSGNVEVTKTWQVQY